MKFPIAFDIDLDTDPDGPSIADILRADVIRTLRDEVAHSVRKAMEDEMILMRGKLKDHMRERMDRVFQDLVEAWDSADDDFIASTLLGSETDSAA
jgi:hypothetical protein